MATDEERELFAVDVLTAVGQEALRLGASEVTGFLAMVGQAYRGDLMVVGRAVNGWTDPPTALGGPAEASRYATLVQESVGGNGRCPMGWVTARWGAKEGYNTKRSAFWRSIRRVVHGLGIADIEGAGWSSHLLWSNLYKVSPTAGGNPSKDLRRIQFRGCAELLKLEFRTHRPSRVLFLTGVDWARPFLGECKLEDGAEFK